MTVLIALISLVGVVIAATLPSMLNHRWLRQNVGKANGGGTVVEMLTTVIEKQGKHDERLKVLEEIVL